MESTTVERVTEWDSEPFTGGHAGLRDRAEQDFTGAVTDGMAWLFMLNGRVLGVFDGEMSQFADADGTAYVAPDRSLPLLFVMQESGGELRGEYYTEETPLSEVDQTLQSGNFTGYVELSENVLSGDYHLVYYGGRQMSVAFVGNQERRLTGDEAYERAADEVGIYRVKTVDLNIVDIPEPEPTGSEASTAAATGTEETNTESTAERSTPEERSETTPGEAAGAAAAAAGSDADDRTPDSTEEPAAEPQSTPAEPSDRHPATGRDQSRPVDAADGSPSEAEQVESGQSMATASAERAANETATESEESAPTNADTSSTESAGRSRFEAESQWRGTTTIPALDPTESVSMQTGGQLSEATATEKQTPESQGVPSEEFAALQDERDRLRERVAALESETERLSGERERLERERDEAAATAEELEAECDELRGTVDRLEAELEAVESELEAAQEYIPEGDHELSPERAMDGTSLFVRYERKGGPTLEDAHNGDAGREAVNDNIRLEHHTEFDDDGAIVDGRPFDEWLRDTIEYGFVQWVTRTFVHDVRETRNQTAMRKLFDAIPKLDRVEFRGTVDIDDEEADAESASFDVVLRDRMGQPLVVTDLNDSREPATEPMMESLIRNATPVGETNEQFAAAFFVASSYYEPGALEIAEDATGGGFLSRGKHKSFARLSRTDGYHLCLIETREGEFHVSLPEL